VALSQTKRGLSIYDLDTPATLVDLDRLERNIREWQSRMDRCGVKFRPHVKTHKVPEIAHMQIAAGAVGIVCAKVSEAEPFVDDGIEDVCIAYPVFGEIKWKRIAELAKKVKRLTVNCDSEEAASGLSEPASKAGVIVHVQIDMDSGLHRGGVPFADRDSIAQLARKIISMPGLQFSGVTTFRSNSFPQSPSAKDAGLAEGRLIVEIAEQLRATGIEVRDVTAGSTPTGKWVAEVPGITEVRAGNYVFNDLMQLDGAIANEDQLALSVLCTVVSGNGGDRLTIDGGSKTFSGDAGGVRAGQTRPPVIARSADRRIFVDRLSEEHGVARAEEGFKLGEKIRFFPYHACTCANLSDEIVGFRGERVEVVWPVRARGLRT
jgi:D-serine deaminase-like pyridoxal phosphate-dependent protein